MGLLLFALAGAALAQPPGTPASAWPGAAGAATSPGPAYSAAPNLARAQAAYAQALALEQANQPGSVDYYYAAIADCWAALHAAAAAAPPQPLDAQAWAVYHDSLARLIPLAQRHGRLDPRRGLTINTATGAFVIPTRYAGFSWKPEDFRQVAVVGEYRTSRPRHVYRRPGLGVPLIVISQQGAATGFLQGQTPFAATAVLRPAWPAAEGTPPPSATLLRDAGPALDFYDSLRVIRIPFGGGELDLAGDITAPLALAARQTEEVRLRDRLLPRSSTNPAELFFLEPYRPGKIPIVFIHGLLSDPATWVDCANELRAAPQVSARFQIWGFRYPTVDPFLSSAAALRGLLWQAVAAADPGGTDPALRHVVLVGHSMGGLISKLQITYSGSTIWNGIANRPLETIVADEGTKALLRQNFFFEPVPYVRRVVFIATPHGGSSLASRTIGQLGSSCIELSPEAQRLPQTLVQYNPNTFSALVTGGFPNSIDLLEPTSPLLAAMQQLPINPQVRMHSIIGQGYPLLAYGDSDGVVPVSSARHPGVQTENLLRAKHTEIHRDPQTIQMLLYILSLHYAEYQAAEGR